MSTETNANQDPALGVQIEGDELVVSGWRYKLADIESTEVLRVATAATGPILMTSIGAICLISFEGEGGLMRALFGAALLIAAGIWWTQKKPFYKVCLHLTRRGEATAFESPNQRDAARVQTAIDQARATSRRS